MTLRTRVMLLIGLVLGLGIVLGAVLAGLEARSTLQAELRAGLVGGEQTVRSTFEEIRRSDHADHDLREVIATFNGNRHVRAQLIAPDGAVMAQSIDQQAVRPAPAWFAQMLGSPPASRDIPSPVAGGARIRLTPIPDIDVGAHWSEFCVIIFALGLSILVSLILVYIAIGAALSPLRKLSDGFVRIGAGDYDVQVEARGPSELAELQRGFNDMGARLAAVSTRNRALEKQLITLQDEERADIARDLHDEIGPHLFAVNVGAEMIGKVAGATRAEGISDHVQSIQKSVRHMQGHVRQMLGRLRPSRVTELGLNAAIGDLMAFWQQQSKDVEIVCALAEDESFMDEGLKDTLYRVVQESLSNAIRHSGAGRVEISIAREEPDCVAARIDDDGRSGPITPAQSGFGIAGMRERVMASAGTLTVEASGRLGGWSVSAVLPAAPAEEPAWVDA